MTYSHVQGTTHSGQSGTSVNVTLGSTVTSGSVVTGVVGWVGSSGGTDTLVSATDDKGNAYTIVGTQFNSLGTPASHYYWGVYFSTAPIANGASVITLTLSASGSFVAVMGDEWSGLPGSYSLIGSGSDIIEGTSLSVTIAASVSAFCAAYGVNIASTGIAGGQTEVQNVIATWMAEWITASGTSQVMTTTFSGSNPGTLYAFSLGDVTPPPPSDTVYYVSNSGSDTNNGTSPSSPWQTIAHVNAQIYSDGDQVLLHGGNVFTDSLVLGSGNYSSSPPTSGNPLTIGSYGTGVATISASGAHGVELTDIGNIVVQNLIITGDGSTGFNGVFLNITSTAGLSDIVLTNLDISAFGRGGVLCVAPDHASAVLSGVTIQDCVISNCTGATGVVGGAAGICFAGPWIDVGSSGFSTHRLFDDILVTRSTVSSCPGSPSGPLYQSGSGILVTQCTNSEISYNFVDSCGAQDNQGNAGIEYNWATDCVAKFNEIHLQQSNTPSDGDGIDFDIDCQNCIMEYNYIHECFGFGALLFNFSGGTRSGCIMRYNILEANASFADTQDFYSDISVAADSSGNAPTGVVIHNNTVYATQKLAMDVQYNTVTGHIANNIFYSIVDGNTYPVARYGSGATVNGNNYFQTTNFHITYNGTSYTSFSAFQSGASQEANGLSVDPKLVKPGFGGVVGGYGPPQPTAYQLLQGSPMIGAGLDLSGLYSIDPGTQDFYGSTIPLASRFNIGAYGGVGGGGGLFKIKLGFGTWVV